MHNVSSTRVAEFDFLTENLDSGCLIKVARLEFFGRIPPKFEHYLRRHE